LLFEATENHASMTLIGLSPSAWLPPILSPDD